MLVVQMPVKNSSSSKVRKCMGMKRSRQQYGSACKHGAPLSESCSSKASRAWVPTDMLNAASRFVLIAEHLQIVAHLQDAV